MIELKKEIMREGHDSTFSAHPERTKMYRDLKQKFWWRNMKGDIADYVSKCSVCQQMKIEHQSPTSSL